MPQIPLTKNRFASVDPADYHYLTQLGSWCYSNSGYAVHYYTDENGKRKTLYMHREISQRVYGKPIPPGLQVDHIDLNRLNNCRNNLRFALRNQNQAHKNRARNNTSGFKGVSFRSGKWEARIKFYSRRLHLGCYENALTAALIYDAASRRLYAEFAGCNFPDTPTPSHIAAQLELMLARYGM